MAATCRDNGRRLGKRAFLSLVENEPSSFRSLTVRDVRVRIFGSMAQASARAPWELEDGRSGVSRYIDIRVWRDCRWLVASAQITLLPQESAGADTELSSTTERRAVELRSYNLVPGARPRFHRLLVEEAG